MTLAATVRGQSLWVELTGLCNWSCQFCYNPWRPLGVDERPRALDFDAMTAGLDRLISRTTIDYVALSGGEPLISADLDAYVTWLTNRKLYSILTTNGALLTEERVNRLRSQGIGAIQVSFLSLDPKIHAQAAGTDSWVSTVAGICQSVRAGIHTTVVITMTASNAGQLSRMVAFAYTLGVRSFVVNRLQYAGSAALNESFLALDEAKESSEVDRLRSSELGQTVDVVISPPSRQPNPGEPWHRLAVSPSGDLKLCNMSSRSVGNISSMQDDELDRVVGDLRRGRLSPYIDVTKECGCLKRRLANDGPPPGAKKFQI